MELAEVSRAVWGVAMLSAPRPLLCALRTPPDRSALTTARVLGARHVLQALATASRPTPTVRDLGMAVDGTHALTAIVAAACDRRWRVPALIEASLAAIWITTAWRKTRDSRRGRGGRSNPGKRSYFSREDT